MAMMLGVLLASSSVLVSCSDDDVSTLGAVCTNSLQTTSTTATAYWTIVSNGTVDGYKVVINEGTRESKGAVVVEQNFGPKETTATFTGLKPNTTYVITTQGIPSATSGFTSADTYELQFMTAPLVENIKFGTVTYKTVKEEDKDGNEVETEVGTVTVTWDAIDSNNCGGYTAVLYGYTLADPTKAEGELLDPDDPNSDTNEYAWRSITNVGCSSASANSATFTDVITPGIKYYCAVRPNANNACWYANGEYTKSAEITAPAAQ